MKKIYDGIITAILCIMILMIAIMFVPKFFGINPYVVVSASMEPEYSKGELIYVKSSSENLEEGDVITFYTDKNVIVTHRIVQVNENEHTYVTKGDANDAADPIPVNMNNVIGEPIVGIPKLGVLADMLCTKSGKIMYIGIIVILILLLFLGDVLLNKKQKGRNTDEDSR